MKNKKIIIILIIFTTTLLISKVKAGTKDYVLEKNRIEGIYAIAPLSDKTHLYYLQKYTLNGIISYCIEPGKDITTELYNSTSDIEEEKRITNLSKEQLDYIKAIAYFGYGYPNHNDNKYYMAAQELIWEYIENTDITWTTILDINGPTINIDSYKNEIKELATRYLTKPNLPATVVYNIGSNNTIIDDKNSIEFYTAVSQKNQEVSITNNRLKISIGPKNIKSDAITVTRKNNYNRQAMIHNFENSQVMLSTGNLERIHYDIFVIVKGATLTLNVIDKDTNKYESEGIPNLNDTQYEIYNKDKSFTAKIIVGYPGISKIANLSYDTYYIKLVKPGIGYKKDNDEIPINIDKISNQITLKQEVIKSNIEINKFIEEDDKNILEAGIIFEVYDSNNSLFKSITTSKEGHDIITLPYGIYTIKQQNTTDGYKKVEDITININDESNENIKYNLVDKKIKYKVLIKTVDKETNENIKKANIKYKILNKTTNKYVTYKDKNNKEQDIYYTNELGNIIQSIELPFGEYILEQIKEPQGYSKNKEKIEFTINTETELTIKDEDKELEIIYYNYLQKNTSTQPVIKENNPQTSDKINNHLITLIISLILLTISIILIKKNNIIKK